MKIGFVDYYLDEWHANNYPALLKKFSDGEIEVAYAFAEIDAPSGVTTDAWCKKYGVKRCNSIEELTELSDGIVVLSPDNCERHEELCKIPLASGKPCYVDKTFADDKATAERIFKNADEHNTPCYSTSSMRYCTELEGIDKTGIEAISAWGSAMGPNRGYDIYAVHHIELIVMLMGVGAKKVMVTYSGDDFYSMNIIFKDGRTAVFSSFRKGSPVMMNIASSTKNIIIKLESDFVTPFIKEMIRFFKTRKVRVPHEETVHIMAIREAGFKAYQTPGVWVDVE